MPPSAAACVDATVLADALAGRLQRTPDRILFLTRDDLRPGRAFETRFSGSRVELLSKPDFQGMSAARVLRRLRRDRHDVFVLHDRLSEQARLADLYRLVSLAVRADRRFLLAADIRRDGLAPGWRLDEVGPGALPGLFFRLAREALAILPVLAFTGRSLRSGPGKRPGLKRKESYRIAYLRTDYAFGIAAGGSVSHISGVTGGMLAAGHRVRFLSSDRMADIDPERTPVTVIPPAPTIRVFDEAAMAAYHHRFTAEAEKILRRDPPDLLYQRHSVFNAAGAVLSRRLGIPLILEANNSEVWARSRWSRLQLPGLARDMEAAAFRGAAVIVTVSKIGADQIIAEGADPERILVNPNGVDPDRFHPGVDGSEIRRAYGFAPDAIVCGFLGTFTRWHGVQFLADQVPPLLARHPRLRFLFMGDGDLRSAVEEQLGAAGLREACVFTGMIDHGAVPAHLAACDILISPHLPFEDGTPFFGSPTKLFEYMAMGRAVVASNLGQIGEVIEDGISGMLYRPGSGEEFLDRMSRVAGDPEQRRGLGEMARRRVAERYTWRRNAERALKFLEEKTETSE